MLLFEGNEHNQIPSINAKNFVITLAVVVYLEQLSNALFTADIPSPFRIFVYNDLTSIVTRQLFLERILLS